MNKKLKRKQVITSFAWGEQTTLIGTKQLHFVVSMKVDFVLALALLVADVDSRDNFANGDEFIVDATLFELVGGGSVELHCSA